MDPVGAYPSGHLLEGLELFLVEERVFRDEVEEVFVAGVDVGLGPNGHESVEVVNVDVDEDAIQPGQNLLADGGEVLGEGHVRRHGEDVLVVDLRFNPGKQNQSIYILYSYYEGLD